ncbi:MAG TPA: hypothetical protein VIY72_15365 [Acidimicrobiales bacterium]
MPRSTATERLASNSPSGNGSEEGRTYDDLYDEAKRRKIPGRSKMSKTELERALAGR